MIPQDAGAELDLRVGYEDVNKRKQKPQGYERQELKKEGYSRADHLSTEVLLRFAEHCRI